MTIQIIVNTTIIIIWSPPACICPGLVVHYQITYRVSKEVKFVALPETTNLSQVVKKLSVNINYEFTITAKYHGGDFGPPVTRVIHMAEVSVVHWMRYNVWRVVFTARCHAERGYATLSRLSVCPSVCDVQVGYADHRLEYFENYFHGCQIVDFIFFVFFIFSWAAVSVPWTLPSRSPKCFLLCLLYSCLSKIKCMYVCMYVCLY